MWRLASHAPSDRGLARGSAWQRTTTPYNNKETVSVNMTWDLSGHNYGVQLVLKRKEITEDLAVDAPRHARAFDDETDVVRKQSRHCILSRTKVRNRFARLRVSNISPCFSSRAALHAPPAPRQSPRTAAASCRLLAFAWRALISCVAFRFLLHAPQHGMQTGASFIQYCNTSGCSTR
jgi:hypothetical protein